MQKPDSSIQPAVLLDTDNQHLANGRAQFGAAPI